MQKCSRNETTDLFFFTKTVHTKPMSQIEIENALLQLPLKARAELAHKLLVSLDEPNESELEQSWATEADRRILAAEQGEMKRYSREEMLERVKNALS